MPGNVQNEIPVDVLPKNLCTKFRLKATWFQRTNRYRNGERQTEVAVQNAIREWELDYKLATTELKALRDFFDAHKGKSFWFYDPYEGTPFGNWDATGTSTSGRFSVRFNSGWRQTQSGARHDVSISLIEVG
jgi:phage-related protein